jgi:hypothetical protein
MDKIVKSILDEFVKTENLEGLETSEAFVNLANYCTLAGEIPDTVDIGDVSTDDGDDGGIDGFALVVNGNLVTDEEELEDILLAAKYIEATYYFVQSKTSEKFDGGEMGTFLFGVREFFNDGRKIRFNAGVQEKIALSDSLYRRAAKMTKGNPTLRLYYVTTGKWTEDQTLLARISVEKDALLATNLFREVIFTAVDAQHLTRLYRAAKNRIEVEVNFPTKVPLPDINGVQQAFLGILSATEYLKVIQDEQGNIRKSLFYENVRDYQGPTDVNKEISESLASAKQDRFGVLNNGITIVARELQQTGTRIKIADFQIVNGCQTSHVIHNERDHISDKVFVAVKLISTTDEDVAASITKATNRQTALRPEQLFAISDFSKKVEAFFETFRERKEQLFYERRSKQYSSDDTIEKTRIISMQQLVSSFIATFLGRPHEVSRSFGRLLDGIGKDVFAESHRLEPYYISGLATHKLEYLFRRKVLSPELKVARYPVLFAFRVLAGGTEMPAIGANKMEKYCNTLKSKILGDDAEKLFRDAAAIVEATMKEQQAQFRRPRDMIRSPDFTRTLRKRLGLPG